MIGRQIVSILDGAGAEVRVTSLDKLSIDPDIEHVYGDLTDFSFCMASQNNLVFDDDGAMHYEPGIKMFEPGHKDHEVFARLLEALKLTQQLGISNIEARIRALSVRLSTGLKAQSVELIGDPDLDDFDRANILCIPNKKEYAEALAASKIDCSVRGKAIRFSIHAYNNEEDVDALLAVFSK